MRGGLSNIDFTKKRGARSSPQLEPDWSSFLSRISKGLARLSGPVRKSEARFCLDEWGVNTGPGWESCGQRPYTREIVFPASRRDRAVIAAEVLSKFRKSQETFRGSPRDDQLSAAAGRNTGPPRPHTDRACHTHVNMPSACALTSPSAFRPLGGGSRNPPRPCGACLPDWLRATPRPPRVS